MTVHESGEGETLDRILQEATRLFVAGGYQGVSMREIGEAVGISKAGLYYHFRDKEALFIAILHGSLEEIARILDEAEAKQLTARGQVERLVSGLLALPPERRALIRVASQEIVHVSPKVRAAFNQVYQEKFVGRISSLLEGGMKCGELREIDPQLAAWLLLGMAYPFFGPMHAATGSMGETTKVLVQVFFEGLAA